MRVYHNFLWKLGAAKNYFIFLFLIWAIILFWVECLFKYVCWITSRYFTFGSLNMCKPALSDITSWKSIVKSTIEMFPPG